MKKLIALLLSLMMMAGMCSAFAEGDLVLISAKDPLPVDAAVQEVTLRIEGAAKNLYYKTVALQENDTVLTLTYTVTDSPYGGKYLSELAGEKEAAFGGYDGWMYAVNGEMPMDTIDAHALKAGDSVLLYFGDMSILQPIVTVVRTDAAVVLKVEADVTTYDEQWNPTTTRQPIAQAKLTVDGADYTTDEAGQVTLSAETAAKDAVPGGPLRPRLSAAAEGGGEAPVLLRCDRGRLVLCRRHGHGGKEGRQRLFRRRFPSQQ